MSSTLAFTIRPGQLADLDLCLTLDNSHRSEIVWQMFRTDNNLDGAESSFSAVRLPRVAEGSYPREPSELLANLHQQDCFLVATMEPTGDVPPTAMESIVGFVGLHEQRWQRAGWLQNLVVDAAHRRQGVGTALFHAAAAWARSEGLQRLLLEAPTKNGAAIRFYQRLGASFCGYNDRYYTNGDIAVFFDYRL
ncbi:MAG: GNAT family N-acetyltransferase [Anaerolineales bacterium]|nr:GNAT family N-acetyltransferase [Anaerolineales bacterium]MCB9172248.1 GNAT family N-acetyltransferase [Ardenticatenales bacterium]